MVVVVKLLHCILNLCPKIFFVYYNGIFPIFLKSNVVLNTKRLAGYPTLSSQGLGFVADMQFGRVQSQINFSQKLSLCPFFFFYKLIDNLLFICLYCIWRWWVINKVTLDKYMTRWAPLCNIASQSQNTAVVCQSDCDRGSRFHLVRWRAKFKHK